MATLSVKFENELITNGSTTIKIFATANPRAQLIQNSTCTAAGIAIQNYGVAMIPYSLATSTPYVLEAKLNNTAFYATQSAVEAVTLGNYLTMSDSYPT